MLPGVRRLDFAAQRPILCMRRGNAVCVMFLCTINAKKSTYA